MAKIERVKQDPKMPKGVPFFSIKSGDTHFAKTSAQIQAYINSSDMGVNASRSQDYGWRLAKDWVAKVRTFRNDETKMESLSVKYGGRKITTPQILIALYSGELRAYNQTKEDNQNPFEEQYLQDISNKSAKAKVAEDLEEAKSKSQSQAQTPASKK